jgi:hypothetical protein
MARLFRTAILMACFLTAGSAFAAGGACPTGANYLNASGSLVTLSSLGVTSCFYISAAGADTNSGTSEAMPWLHSPGMKNCSNTCAGVTPAAGLGFIFRGGDTWHFGNSSASPYAGVVANCQINGTTSAGLCLSSINKGASSGPPIYYGVDPTWFSGGSWSRPILTADNPLTPNPRVFADFVASCTYQVGAQNYLTTFADSSHIIFDNFELTGLCSKILNGNGGDVYLEEAGATNNIYEHIYIHGWTHIQFSCSGGTGYCFNLRAIHGNTTGLGQFIQIVVDGSDSDPAGLELIYNGGYIVSQSVFRYTAQGIPNGFHIWNDNLLEHWYCPGDSNAHPNLLESNGDAPGMNALYNNVFRNIITDSGSCPVNSIVGIWLLPPVGSTDYLFNNVFYNTPTSGIEYINISNHSNPTGTQILFNNTFEDAQTNMFGGCFGAANPYTAANNHYIFNSASPYDPSCAYAQTTLTNLLMTHATATTDGYTAAQTFAYSPTAANSPTVGAATNEQSFCTALSTAGLSAAATACRSDTTYGVSYNAANHTAVYPARTTVARPASSAWDRGAYQSGGTQVSGPNPPTGLVASVQ